MGLRWVNVGRVAAPSGDSGRDVALVPTGRPEPCGSLAPIDSGNPASLRSPLSLPSLGDLTSEFSAPAEFFEVLSENSNPLPSESLGLLTQFVGLLAAARPFLNVTALREPDDLWMKLILDAVLLLPALESLPEGAKIVDVGCGGGFPGLPLAIAKPRLKFTLVDATAKKVAFVQHVTTQLQLQNVEGVVGRAEALAAPQTKRQPPGPYREQFDLVTARAVAALPLLLEYVSPFARPPGTTGRGGALLLVKGQGAEDELATAQRAIRELCVKHAGTTRTPTGTLLHFDKLAPTPVCYPRENGAPKRNPL